MKLQYNLDLNESSTWFVNTPNAASQRLPFYINECGHYQAGPKYFTERQGLRNYLLFYTVAGTGLLKYRNQEYTLAPQQAVVINCFYNHFYQTASGEHWDFKWVHFNGTAAQEYYRILNNPSLCVNQVHDPGAFGQMLDSFQLYLAVNNVPGSVQAAAQMVNIFSLLISGKFNPVNLKKFTEHQREVQKVIDYILANYHRKINLDDLLKIACLSKYYFLRVFKTYTGVSPYEYLTNYRINKAKELLKNTALSINEIVDRIGFSDYNGFIHKFKEVVGITPHKYRKDSGI